jgi:hypothetical protein
MTRGDCTPQGVLSLMKAEKAAGTYAALTLKGSRSTVGPNEHGAFRSIICIKDMRDIYMIFWVESEVKVARRVFLRAFHCQRTCRPRMP